MRSKDTKLYGIAIGYRGVVVKLTLHLRGVCYNTHIFIMDCYKCNNLPSLVLSGVDLTLVPTPFCVSPTHSYSFCVSFWGDFDTQTTPNYPYLLFLFLVVWIQSRIFDSKSNIMVGHYNKMGIVQKLMYKGYDGADIHWFVTILTEPAPQATLLHPVMQWVEFAHEYVDRLPGK